MDHTFLMPQLLTVYASRRSPVMWLSIVLSCPFKALASKLESPEKKQASASFFTHNPGMDSCTHNLLKYQHLLGHCWKHIQGNIRTLPRCDCIDRVQSR